jgi:putative ABC transport system permease protein
MSDGWGLALRMARRETRRRPGRTALVAALVGLPVAALVAWLGLVRTLTLTGAEARAAERGRADEVIGVPDPALLDAAVAEVEAAAPPGTRIVAVATANDAVVTPAGLEPWMVSDEPLDDPVLDGRYELLEGRAPARPGEAAVPPQFVDDAGAGVGDTGELLRLGPIRITGVAASPGNRGGEVLVAGPLPPGPSAGMGMLYVDLPDRAALGPLPGWLEPSGPYEDDESLTPALGFGYGAAAAGLLLTGTVVAAAFAVGARRQLRTLGLLGASGLPPAALRRIVVLQGTVTGVVGGLAGVAAAVAILLAIQPHLARSSGQAVAGLDLHPLDLVGPALFGAAAATVAARGPAATAARVPVLNALAGRQGQRPVPPAVPALGMAVASAGILAVAGSAANRGGVWGTIGVAGALAVVAGGAMATPWLVSRLEPLAHRARGALRVAARGLARNRSRSGAVATAVMTPVGLAAFALTLAASDQQPVPDDLAADQVLVEGPAAGSVDRLVSEVRGLLPGATEATVRVAADPSSDGSVPLEVRWGDTPTAVGAASPELLDALDLPAEAGRALARGEVVARFAGPDGGPVLPATTADADVAAEISAPVVVDDAAGPGRLPGLLVSEEWLAERGLATLDQGVLFRASGDLSAAQRAAVEHATADRATRDAWIRSQVLGMPPPVIDAWVVVPDVEPAGAGALTGLLTAAILGFTLIVVAVGLALNAAESRDERDLLAALGAPPRVQRSVTAWQALLLPLAGAAVGAPLGVACAAAVRVARSAAEDVPAHLSVPWVGMALLLVAVPVASAVAARLAATIAGLRRPDLAPSLAGD